ncbi:MAG: hypothetical protein OXB95_04750 [Rhodobacteraceae bacterium]|nr:hypothetical protein [Paracoccaceae bacterium]
MTRFSERYGFAKPKPMLKADEITPELRNGVWNTLDKYFRQGVYNRKFDSLSCNLRHYFFKLPVDERSSNSHSERETLLGLYFGLEFPRFYDFLEFLVGIPSTVEDAETWTGRCNKVLEEERARFRFVGKLIAPITEPHEIEEIENASSDGFGSEHIRQAVSLYAKRPNPDYRNSIKESISAVEATLRNLTGKKHRNINHALADLGDKRIDLHPALKKGFSRIYGWTNDENGIRHALMDSSSTVGEAEARLMLVMCSAYVNYLTSLSTAKDIE